MHGPGVGRGRRIQIFRDPKLGGTHVGGFGSLATLPRFILDLLAVLKGFEPVTPNVREVNEQVVPSIIRSNESVTLLIAEPLHGADSQLPLLTRCVYRGTQMSWPPIALIA